MSSWQLLVQQGILGTARQPTTPELPVGLDALWVTSAEQSTVGHRAPLDAAQRFLQAAAILTHYEAAGKLPTALEARPGLHEIAAARPETQPSVGAKPAQLLQQLVRDFDSKLMVEWLAHAAKAGAYLPHEMLAFLLGRATKERMLATALVPCLGERGRWLMALNPRWQIDVGEALDETHWHEGSIQARITYLQNLREQAPALARAALAAVWSQEATPDRAALLATLRTKLSADDLPFLDEAHSDRSLNVRIQAGRLLATVPQAALHRELMAQLSGYLKLERQWLKRQLVVTLPAYFREEWRAYGVREQSPLGVRIGQKAGWLVQLIALVPPSALVTALGVDAVELLDLIRASDHAEALSSALLEGAEQHQDYTFLLAELHHLLRLIALSQAPQSEFIDRFGRYAPVLPQPERLSLVQRYLDLAESRAFGDWATLQAVLRHCGALPPLVTTQLLTKQMPTLLQRNTRDYGIGRILLDLAYQLAPADYPQAAILFQRRHGEERPEYIDRFLQIYHFRYQMIQAFGDQRKESSV